nr:MAG TPA: hypothetical protein [Caudoviricetes sp.]
MMCMTATVKCLLSLPLQPHWQTSRLKQMPNSRKKKVVMTMICDFDNEVREAWEHHLMRQAIRERQNKSMWEIPIAIIAAPRQTRTKQPPFIAEQQAAIKRKRNQAELDKRMRKMGKASGKHLACFDDLANFLANGLCKDRRVESVGKPQNNSGKSERNGYAESVGKPQNNSSKKPHLTYAEMKRLVSFIDQLHKKRGLHKCRDKVVVAIVTHIPTGMRLFGINGIRVDAGCCPRNIHAEHINSGYQRCIDICQQEAHAEMMACDDLAMTLPLIGGKYSECVIDVYGANGICGKCLDGIDAWGIRVGKVENNLVELLKVI